MAAERLKDSSLNGAVMLSEAKHLRLISVGGIQI